MSGEIIVQLTDGRRIPASEVEVLSRRNGEWLRCVTDESSPRMAFDETTTYYHLERDVDEMYTTDDDRSTAAEIERSSSRRAKIANAICND